jgi:hypothetical protein
MHRKPHLPQKICARCGRPFAWRRKWARDWEAVRYCSRRCQEGKTGGGGTGRGSTVGGGSGREMARG